MVKWIEKNGKMSKELEKGDKIRSIGITAILIIKDEEFKKVHTKFDVLYRMLNNEVEKIKLHELTLIPNDLKEIP